jgi:hypothetical protein
MEDNRGMRFDIFDRQVCRGLELSQGMKTRARVYQSFGNLDVYLMAPEDIFLFKGITERATDLEDMRVLAEVGLNWRTIEQECVSQKGSGQWAYMLGTKLLELRAKSGIESPIIKKLMDHADLDLLTHVFGNVIGRGNSTFNEIAQAIDEKYRYSASWTRKQLAILYARWRLLPTVQIVTPALNGRHNKIRVRVRHIRKFEAKGLLGSHLPCVLGDHEDYCCDDEEVNYYTDEVTQCEVYSIADRYADDGFPPVASRY